MDIEATAVVSPTGLCGEMISQPENPVNPQNKDILKHFIEETGNNYVPKNLEEYFSEKQNE